MSSAATVAIPAILMGGAVVWICAYFWREGRDLRAAGVEATARLVRKYRRPGDPYMLGLENCFVTAQFYDAYGVLRTAEIRVPSRHWHWLRDGATETILYLPANPLRARVISRPRNAVVSMMMIFGMCCGGFMVVMGLFFLASGSSFTPSSQAVAAAPPPPTKFDKTGVDRVMMSVSPQHDRVAIIDEAGRDLRIREIGAGTLVASTRGKGWRLLDWRPDGARIAVAEGPATLVLDAASLQPIAGEPYTWSRPAAGLASCPGTPVWDAAGTQAAAPCGNRVMVLGPAAARLLTGPTDRVLGVAWSPSGRRLAAVSEDNYVRAWDPETQRCVAVSEDYPYPRAIWFADEHTVVVIDVALRQYTFRL